MKEVALHPSNDANKMKYLISGKWKSALSDCGASKAVCGEEWLTQYINNLKTTKTNQKKLITSIVLKIVEKYISYILQNYSNHCKLF